ncbi:hypothetical protein [Paraburkholderia caledonica]|uniref:hypothetical protein n=1 Tax=Paraburkholderia caledonica TaxID=134536 RepID=UPI0011789C28|nr:hypothetical protein [Paraburkholderia caledonica]
MHALRVYFKEALDEQVREIWGSSIQSNRLQLDQLIAATKPGHPIDSTNRHLLELLLNDVGHTTANLTDWSKWGFSYFNQVATGCVVTMAAMSLLDRPRAMTVTFAHQIATYFKNAISPDIDTSIMSARNAAAKLVSNSEDDLNSRLNQWWEYRMDHRNHSGPGDPYTTFLNNYVKVNGNPAAGVVGTEQSFDSFDVVNSPAHPGYPGPKGSVDAVVGDIQSRLQTRGTLVAQVDRLDQYVKTCSTIADALGKMS